MDVNNNEENKRNRKHLLRGKDKVQNDNDDFPWKLY